MTQWNAKLCVDHFRALWARNQRPLGVLVFPYWPDTRASPMNLWVDAATVRGYLLFERTVSRERNPLLFATALLVGLEPVKYYAYVNSNAQRWAIGDKLDCGKAGNIGGLPADEEVVMQLWMRCGVTPEHAADAFKFALHFTFEAYILRRLPDLPCPAGLLDLYETARTVDIYGRGPSGVAPMVNPWQAWVPSKVSPPGTTWTSNQPPPPNPAVPLWPADMDEKAPVTPGGYVHDFAGSVQHYGTTSHGGPERTHKRPYRGSWTRTAEPYRGAYFPHGQRRRGTVRRGGLAYSHELEAGHSPTYYTVSVSPTVHRLPATPSIPPMPGADSHATVSFTTAGRVGDINMG
ncbi:hypothetical protein K488DRAFT_75277 [Vararia minispora EC-137]|uniref:Uncharacterized protein n=1 Tax=Vararia minispora EC-137 TaxID=1314806 RepID=A0ACB8Q4Q2_9AGAM|nr:hypothetical protein K488DRAFT_75277 [Vararia minispora EC-137]